MVGVEGVGRQWREHVRLGRSDALLALLSAPTPNLETVVFACFQTPQEVNSALNWSDLTDGGDDNYLARLFRGATNGDRKSVV